MSDPNDKQKCGGSGYAIVNQYGGVGDCPGCPDCDAARSAMERRTFFRVEVSDHGGQIVAIEPAMLCGRDIADDERAKIEAAIEQLRAFIGTGRVTSCAPRGTLDGSAAEVKRYIFHDGEFRVHQSGDWIDASAYDALLAQLPEGMKQCTIKLAECAKCARLWLQPTNWVDHGCPHCKRDALASRVAELERDAARYQWLRSEEVSTDPIYYPFWEEFNAKLCRCERLDALIDKWMHEVPGVGA